MNILCTGGLGYIGSHVVVELADLGFNVTILDDCSCSDPGTYLDIRKSTQRPESVAFSCINLNNPSSVSSLFEANQFQLVLHCAGLKSAPESLIDPLKYYEQNVSNTINLLRVMAKHNCKKLVFSSSASIYSSSDVPATESSPISPSSPYGETKHVVENMLKSLHSADSEWAILCLRYFNPIGAHSSGHLSDKTTGPNVIPSFIRSVKKGKPLLVLGNNYPTADGTAIRDYVDIRDLASAHAKAIRLLEHSTDLYQCLNLGTDKGSSVLEIIRSLESSLRRTIAYTMLPRRPGDNAIVIADSSRAKELLEWEPKYCLQESLESAIKGFAGARDGVSYQTI